MSLVTARPRRALVTLTILSAVAALCSATALAVDGSAVVSGGGIVAFAGASSTNWVYNASAGSYDFVLIYANPSVEGASFTLPGKTKARILAVGGGGGGGGTYSNAAANQPYGGGGGGGAGGMVETNGLFDAGVYKVSVGVGGAGGNRQSSHSATSDYSGSDGGNTTVLLGANPFMTALGGGGGGGERDGHSGGSGGGGSMTRVSSLSGTSRNGGAGVDGQGCAGGSGDAYNYGGGGGGAGGAGAAASVSVSVSVSSGGVGGAGRTSDITGASVMYAAGGGGGCNNPNATAPSDGIAGGANNAFGRGGVGKSVPPTAGEDGTGGGGGGASRGAAGAKGGDGVVIVRIASADPDFVRYLDPVGGTNAYCRTYAVYAGETELASGWWVVADTVTKAERIVVSGDVNLILKDGCTLTAREGVSVVLVEGGVTNSFTIWAQSDATVTNGNAGRLIATSPIDSDGDSSRAYYAGIGGGGFLSAAAGGNITINGGTVIATCSASNTYSVVHGAGIGGGRVGAGGNITINGGNVIATCSASGTSACAYGAGIGGGEAGEGGKIIINGGHVVASCIANGDDDNCAYGAGIGGGEDREGGQIIINGGHVVASSIAASNGYSYYGSGGIGGGSGGHGGTITINGGTVTATGGSGGAGIGGGSIGDGGNVYITGGTVIAEGVDAQAIGYGKHGHNPGNLGIASGLQVTAGADETSANLADEAAGQGAREAACRDKYAKIEPCLGHDFSRMGRDNKDGATHTPICRHCLSEGESEPHTFSILANNGDVTHSICCGLCGAAQAPVSHLYEDGVCACGAIKPPEITGISAAPTDGSWEGKVDISFTVTNSLAGLPDWNAPFLSIVATDNVTGSNYVSVTSALSGDTDAAVGAHSVKWDMRAQGIDFFSTNVTFTVAYLKMPDYCVIDLSGGPGIVPAASYPVSYLDVEPKGGFTNDLYRTEKLVMRLLAPGTFTMGADGSFIANPPHSVTLTQPFYCAVFETTQKQWELVTGGTPSSFKDAADAPMRPVEQVSWNMVRGDANTNNWPSTEGVDPASFVGVLRQKSSLAALDLPTEAQWEYACRAGRTTAYSYGDFSDYDYMWYYGNSAVGSTTRQTHEVGTRKANPWGLYDMHGNVGEWCLDWWGDALSSNCVTNPAGSSSGECRVVRGGGWNWFAEACSSSFRTDGDPSSGNSYVGFRLVRTLLDTPESERGHEVAAGAERTGTVCAGKSDPIALVKTVSVTFSGKFTLTGRELAAGEFTAGLYDTAGQSLQTVTNAFDGSFAFDAISYSSEDAGKTFSYAVRQRAGTAGGVRYDAAEYEVTVVVVGDGAESLVADATGPYSALNFTNEYSATGTGEVKVRKNLQGRAWADDDSFKFTLVPVGDAPAFPKSEVEVTKNSADHVASFETVTFTQPGDYTYTVKETRGALPGVAYDDTDHMVMFRLEDDGEGNLVASDGGALIQTVAITNTFSSGDFTVSNSVRSSTAADLTRAFSFTVTLDDDGINGTYGGMTFTDGVAAFSLKDGEAVTASNLPVGVGFTVTQEAAEGFTTSSENASGTITAAAVEAAFTNTRKAGDLTVSNRVVSNAAVDRGREFSFIVRLSDDGINGPYGGMTFMDGVATLSLKDGETATASDLPADIGYTVAQEAADGFTTSSENASGTITTAGVEAAFTNARNNLELAVTAGKWGAVAVKTNGVEYATIGPDATTNLVVIYGAEVTAATVPDAGFAVNGAAESVSFTSYTENTNLVFAFLPNPAATLRWKYSSAVGRYFAQIAISAHAGYAEALDGLAFLFADRTNSVGKVYAQLWDIAARAPVAVLLTDNGVEYRGVTLGSSVFAGEAEGTRVLWGVADASFAEPRNIVPAGERQIGLYVRKRVDPVSGNETVAEVGNFLGYLTWKTDDIRYFLPVVEGDANGPIGPSPANLSSLLSHSSLVTRHSSLFTRAYAPTTVGLAATLGLGAAAVADETPAARIAEFAVGADGAVSGRVEVVAGGEASSRFGSAATVRILSAPSPAGPWAAEASAEVDSATGAFALPAGTVKGHFFRAEIETRAVFE